MIKFTIIFLFSLVIFYNLKISQSFKIIFDNKTFLINDIEPLIDEKLSHPDYPNQCYHKPTEHIWDVNEQWGPSERCWIARCIKPGKAIIQHCGSVSVEDRRNCQLIGMDIKQPYPSCCSRFYCKFSNGEQYIYNPLMPGGARKKADFTLFL